jgi:hypothetical protein
MSNVLIGIIGVILFIGLALAGALFLGPKFQDASIDSKAAATLQAVDQTAKAISLMTLDDGKPFAAGQSLLTNNANSPVSRGYLKSLPKQPVNTIYDMFTTTSGGTNSGNSAYVAITLESYTNTAAEKVCLNIIRRTGQDPTATTVPQVTTPPDVNAGCVRIVNGGPTNSAYNGGYFYVFTKI